MVFKILNNCSVEEKIYRASICLVNHFVYYHSWRWSNGCGGLRWATGPLLLRQKDSNQTIKDKRISLYTSTRYTIHVSSYEVYTYIICPPTHIIMTIKLDELCVSLLHIIIPWLGNHVYATCVCFAHHCDTPEKHNGPQDVRTRSIYMCT